MLSHLAPHTSPSSTHPLPVHALVRKTKTSPQTDLSAIIVLAVKVERVGCLRFRASLGAGKANLGSWKADRATISLD